MRINTNISAVIANKNLRASQDKVASSMEKLSSGYRINRAADDSAGMAIAAKLRTQIRGLDQSSRNASDGVSVVQTAEGALNEVEAILQRMRELSVQAASGILVDEDRDAIQLEIEALSDEVNRITRDTEFNKKTLLDGSLDRRSYTNQDGVKIESASTEVPSEKYGLVILENGRQAELAGSNMTLLEGGVVSEDMAGSIVINDYNIDINAGDTAEEVYGKLTDACDRLNIDIEGFNTGALTLTSYDYGSNESIKMDFDNAELAGALGFAVNNEVFGSDVKASFDTDTATDGTQRQGFAESATMTCYGNKVTVVDVQGFELVYEVDKSYASHGTVLEADVTDIGTMTVHIGANEGQVIDIRIPRVDTDTLGIDNINLLSSIGASKAIALLDSAINMVSSIRSELGASQNRLDAANGSISVTKENMDSAISRIEDVDMAEEMSTYTQLNVLSQAGVSMVAQANELPQMVLQLLQ